MDLIYRPVFAAIVIYSLVVFGLLIYHSDYNWEFFGWGTVACLFYIFLILLYETLVKKESGNGKENN